MLSSGSSGKYHIIQKSGMKIAVLYENMTPPELQNHLQQQVEEALGEVNRWYCSQAMGYNVSDPEILLKYYIKNGGAEGYRKRHEEYHQMSAPSPTV